MKDNGLLKDLETPPFPSSVKISNKNNSHYQGGIPKETPESASSPMSITQREQRGDAALTTAAPEGTSVPTPLNPPSKAQLEQDIVQRLISQTGQDIDEQHLGYIHNIVENFYFYHPKIRLLVVMENVFEKWKLSKNENETIRDVAPSYFIWKWIHELGEAKKSLPEEMQVLMEALKILSECPGYPFNYQIDQGLINRAIEIFPDIDIIGQLERKVIYWQEKPETLKAKKSPRIQLWEWFEGEKRYQMNKRKKDEEY